MPINILSIEDDTNLIHAIEVAIMETFPQDEEIKFFPKTADRDRFIESFSTKADTSTSELKKWVKEELIDYILENDIDLIILDLYLYADEHNKKLDADNSSGYKILEELRQSEIGIPVFVNSIISQEMQKLYDDTFATVEGIIEKMSDQDAYADYFGNYQFLIKRILRSANAYKREKIKCDIAVVCALADELEAVKKLPLQWEEFRLDNKIYHRGKLKNYKVVASSENKMGMPEAAALTTRMIDMFRPQYVVMTGIAAGIHEEEDFLDLLIPEKISNWQAGKYKVKKDGKWKDKELHIFEKYEGKEPTYFKDTNIFTEKKDIFNSKIIENLDFNNFSQPKPKSIKFFTDDMVSGSAVVADKDIVNEKIDGSKIDGIDMEAYGVAHACNNHPSQPKAIIIKAITDFADIEKNDDAQPAGKHVSAVAFKVLFEYIISDEQ